MTYSKIKDIKGRHEADQLLATRAFNRLKAKDASVGEKAAALGVTGAMKIKTTLGMGMRRRRRTLKKRRGRGISLSQAILKARKGIKGK
jgi:hypothetical protein